MEELKTITQEIGEPKYDTLRFGLQSVKGEIVGTHPVETTHHSVLFLFFFFFFFSISAIGPWNRLFVISLIVIAHMCLSFFFLV